MFPQLFRVRFSRLFLAVQVAIVSFCFAQEFRATELFSSLRERDESFLGQLIGLDKTEPEACCIEEPASHTLIGTYVIRANLAAKLFLNNKLGEPLEVHPALVSRNGQEMQLPPVIVPANSFEFFNVAEWAALGGEPFSSGTIKLTYNSDMDLVLGAQINFADETNSLSFEERLVEIGRFNSRRQEAMWWMPSDETTVEVFLANTTSEPISVSAVLAAKPSIDEAVQSIELLPYETKVLDLRTDFIQGPQLATSNLIALSLRHSSTANDALLARVWVGEAERGYSTIVRFSNPDTAKMSEYHGAGFQIEDIGNIRFKPVIAARNIGTDEAKVRVRVPYTRSNGMPASVSLPVETIKPGKMVRFDPAKILDRVDNHNIAVAGLEITYDTAPGTIIASAQSVSTDRNHVFRVLLNDPLALPNASGGYPWRIEGTSTTQVYIKNAVDYEQDYVAHIIWEGEGIYTIGSNAIAPHETVNIDIKILRDEQTPDNMGRTIPQTVTRGQIFWSVRRKDSQPAEDALAMRSLVGRSQQVDIAKGIVTDYVCVNCCPNSYQSAFILTSPVTASTTIEVNSNLTLQAFEQQSACPSGNNVVSVGATWSSTNTNVATVTGGNVTGVAPGSATITATWTARTYTKIFTSCQQVAQFQVTASKTVNVVLTPHIDEIAPTGLVPGQSDVLVQIVGTNFGTSPTINVTGGGVTAVYDIQTPDGFYAWFTIDANAQVGDRQLTVTANGRTSNAVTFTVGDNTPVITSISESSASTGETFSLEVVGQHFGLNPTLSISPSGISCAINSSTTTSINATCTVGSNTSPGTREIKVISHGVTGTGFRPVPDQSDTSNGVPFQVTTVRPVISEVTYVEKNGLSNVTLSFEPGGEPTSQTVELKLEKISGSGSATFENGSTVVDYTESNGAPQTFRIKGVTESSAVDNYRVTAEVNGNNSAEEAFTVAVISSLEFERINTTGTPEQQDVPLDNNPGINGVHTTEEGQRIFPDKNTPGDGTDRATLRVKATVAPANVPNLRVYFASFDLDDPSADADPLDPTTSGAGGLDNKGGVNGSKSGVFSSAPGVTCSNAASGSDPSLHVSKIDCPLSNTTSSANFKVTMQPGDNFAIAASLFPEYRNEFKVNTSAGANLINDSSQVIPITGEANSNNVRGLRTRMLTVWRRAHFEVDSMNTISGNNVQGTFVSNQTIAGSGNTELFLNVSTPLDSNRFENGRLAIGAQSFDVINHTVNSSGVTIDTANTGSSVTVENTTGSPFQISAGQSFTLYDDDNQDGTGTIRNGDLGENVPPPDLGLLQPTDTPCVNAYTANNCNILAYAYVLPVYDLGSEEIPFQVDLTDAAFDSILDNPEYFDNEETASSADFWTIYLLGAYQPDTDGDYDPDEVDGIFGSTDVSWKGSAIFSELNRAEEYSILNKNISIPVWYERPVDNRFTVAHEVGHLFGGEHELDQVLANAGLMEPSELRTQPLFTILTLNRIRGGTGVVNP